MGMTINEIARLANVSKSTVSRVINRSGPVSPETEQAVKRAIESVDYRPSEVARSLTLKKTRTICLIVQDIRNPYFARACWHAERFFRSSDYLTVICNADNDPENESSILSVMKQRNVDGILCISGQAENGGIEQFVRSNYLPVVLVDRELDHQQVSSVVMNNVYGGQLAVDYLFSLGHRRIAFVTSPYTAAERQRLRGYLAEHRNRGLPVGHELIVSLDERRWYEGDVNTLLRLFSMTQQPSAIFASNDHKALQVLRLLRRNHIGVPQDISVIGYDDIEIASMVHPSLTTVHQPIDKMVQAGAAMLLRIIQKGEEPGERRVMTPWLVERESVKKQLPPGRG
jgi:LacI family transcriptional regulator